MARQFLTPIDMAGLEIRNVKVHLVASLPTGLTTSDAGRICYLTGTNRFYFWNGSAWINQATDTDAFNGQNAAYYLNLGNATGTTTASKISDLGTVVHAYTLDSFAAPAGPVSANSQKITNLATPTVSTDAANKGYVDTSINSVTGGLALKGSVRVATSTNVSLSSPGATIDGITMAANDVILLMGQTTTSQNGPWVWTASASALTRPANYASGTTATPGSFWDVREGTNADLFALLTTDGAVVVDTTAQAFVIRGTSTAGATTGYGTTVSGTQVNVNAGTGISVPASPGSSVAIDTTIVGRKITGTIPASTTGIFSVSGAVVTINHGLNNQAAMLNVRYGSAGATPGLKVEVDETASDANNIVVTLPSAPVANQFIVQIVG